MPLAELFLSAFIQALFQQLASSLVVAFTRRERIDTHCNKWQQNLSFIQAVIDDAENKQLTDQAVKVWLEGLRDLFYDLEDILEEITTQALIQQHEGVLPRTSLLRKLIPTCSSLLPASLASNHRMVSKVKEISNRFDDIVKLRNGLKLEENLGGNSNRWMVTRLPSTSLNEPHIYGRDKDKEAIRELLIGEGVCQDDVCYVPIVGMGGIGKTTLAQLVYNDRDVKGSFHVRAWVCVSDFDVFTITKIIHKAVTDDSGESKDLNMLQVSLQQELSKSKFLIVLDDIWNEDYEKWNTLCRPFHGGQPGSRIIVTTRLDHIASKVGSVPAYSMKMLTDGDCLDLLAHHAKRGSIDADPDLREIGKGLVKKCKGLPLAAKALGGLLRSKGSKEEWADVLKSKIWDLPEENNILPVLRLSYHHLPSHLKHLFAYCSIFPKDYEFDKNELVLLWMGEGFLHQKRGNKEMEELGFECFNELLLRSFFQRLSGTDSRFVMHDLMNDLAQLVAGGKCYRLDEKVNTNNEYRVPEKTRHASFLRHEFEVYTKFRAFKQVQGLRTFIPMPVQNSHVWPPFYLSNKILLELLPELHRLRVLSLSGYSITELPSNICKLLHIRYLNLSGTSIVSLPDSISDLFNLLTLSLSNCRFICRLPSAVGSLSKLRHLDISNTDQLREMPIEIGNLKSLRTLPKLVVSKVGGLGLRELRNLEHLRGTLAISELQNVTDIEDAKEACLRHKQELVELQLAWGNDIDVSIERSSEKEVLDMLQPHENLRNLKIEFYRGENFPSWVGDKLFCELLSISLGSCSECTSLPPLGQLPKLKHLRIEGMRKVKHVGVEFCGSVVVPFQRLESLRFYDMPEWETWSRSADGEVSENQFPHLTQLTIFKCPKLTNVSPLKLPILHELDLQECNNVVLRSFSNLSKLNYLKVESVTGLSHLPGELLQSTESLEVLECCNCRELLSLWENGVTVEHLVRLRRLVVADCSELVSLCEEEQQMPCNLEVLELFRCASLMSIPNISNLRILREFIIKNCQRLVSFSENGVPPMLRRLEILSCNALESLPRSFSNLERLEIKDCSSLRTCLDGNFAITLKKLSIKNCNQLAEAMLPPNSDISLEELTISKWLNFSSLVQHVHSFSHLFELYLSDCNGLDNFPEQGLPPNLRTLSIEHCSNLKSLPMQIRNLTSLVSLEIRTCRRLQSFPRCDFPPNLSSLRIWDSRKLKPLARWGLHRLTSLREFSICGGFQELEFLGDDGGLFPRSLIKFSIARFPKLTSLSKVLENLTSLQHLSIMNCTSLSVLPSENLLDKLWHLEISDCPPLKHRCLKDKGEYWNKISGIPCVELDGTYIYRQSSG
ncbi:putative disease resistance RPP13-like protein 1 [Olea europaea var. sylvestris]|uniref:putative disease resistance RPP13-like protein 1 n=1 Tax=Olea europaea var. sylvestris TaxID=158386 RepID=UPI000C1CD52C|nr:putative disease resistance RPP13-like protein 1 [Olea europaea var. sylvestris]